MEISEKEKVKTRWPAQWITKGCFAQVLSTVSNADLNEDQEQEPDEMQENDHNLNAEVQANAEPNENVGGKKYLA